MGNNPSPPDKKNVGPKSVIPHVLIAAVLFFAIAIPWLMAQSLTLVPAILISVVVFLLMTAITIALMRTVAKSDYVKTEQLLKENTPDQKAFRKEAWIEGLQTESRKVHDRVFRMGAVISIGLAVFTLVMKLVFGLTLAQIYYVSWPIIGLIWFFQIVFLPRWMTYTSFLIFGVMRVGIQMYGLGLLAMLPQFAMLPVFYLLMMFFMYGSIMLPNLAQIKYFRPGTGTWETPKDSMRGQFAARGVMKTHIDRFIRYSKGESNRPPTRGIVEEGPPGTGKTLFAKEIATELEIPFVFADASAFNAPFAGFGQLIPLIARHNTEALAREFGGAVFVIDEAEGLFGARSGMQQQQSQHVRQLDHWDFFDMTGDQVSDVPFVRTRTYNEQQMVHPMMMMPGAMGGNTAIFPFLTWMSGADSAPFMERTLRGLANTLLNALFVPVTLFGKVLRLPPGKPQKSNVLFIALTNRFWMFDPAMIRPGRFGIVASFVIPDEDERADIIKYYLMKWHKMGYYVDDLIRPERIREFAQTTPNASPAEIEQMIEEAVDVRVQHVAELRRLKRYADEGTLETLLERDRKFWLRFKNTVYDSNGNEITGWDDERVDWQALMETRSSISFGRANPEAVNEVTRRNVAFHELAHFLALWLFNRKHHKPTLLTVVPRRNTLGMLAHIPLDTREQHPQDFYEGSVRVSVASWVAEHFFFGQNLPSVTGDLRNATGVASLMVGKFGMSFLNCPDKEQQEYYREIGEVLISEPETSMFNPQATALLESVLRNPSARSKVAIIIGMAAIDAYRMIRANQDLFLEVVPRFLALDEFSGNNLAELWAMLDQKMIRLEQVNEVDKNALPPQSFSVTNPFYGDTRAEGAAIYEQVVALTTEGGQP